jgi:hypothetical protein
VEELLLIVVHQRNTGEKLVILGCVSRSAEELRITYRVADALPCNPRYKRGLVGDAGTGFVSQANVAVLGRSKFFDQLGKVGVNFNSVYCSDIQ